MAINRVSRLFFVPFFLAPAAHAAEDPNRTLYQESIRSTKQSIARETLEFFYKDALDYYRQKRYAEALELLDKIYSVDPHYENVSTLRTTIQKMRASYEASSAREVVGDFMHKGNRAAASGQNALAISYWSQALAANPAYQPAKKKIQAAKRSMAQKQLEAGFMHKKRGEMEDALDAWSNAIALDPSLKQRGLLTLMSNVELDVRRGQTSRLAAQGFEQFNLGDLKASLSSYQQLLALEPRHEEARRMSGKNRFKLGQQALQAAQAAARAGRHEEAAAQFKASINYGYETMRATQGLRTAEAALRRSKEPVKVVQVKPPTEVKPSGSAPPAEPPEEPRTPPTPAQPADPAKALEHYRLGLGAIRSKDFKQAVDQLEIAVQLDPGNERIYMALERAKQEWSQLNTGR